MEIDNIKITLVKQKGGLVAFAALVIGGGFYVCGIGIHEKLDGSGYRLTYPTRKSGEQVYDICHPINRKISKSIESAIFKEFKAVLNKGCNNVGHNSHQFTT